ncbi:MAG: NUDIX hydrolase [Imperialibacter sp.]|uniref:NUDIX hydrolase n=1 Tax=Imperialibacter sp. TaxID=2038411 RepID=UPI0032ED47AE
MDHYVTAHSSEVHYAPRFVSLLQNFPGCFRRDLVSGHITGSAWVVSPALDQVVLLHHKKLSKWLQPGGHADGEEDVLKVAAKELEEETGLGDYKWLTKDIFDIDIHLIPERGNEPVHFHYDIRFIAMAEASAPLVVSNESRDVRWVSLSSVTAEAGFEESILRMVKKTHKLKESLT